MTLLTIIVAAVCLVAVPAQAQLGGLGKSAKSAAKSTVKEAQETATETAKEAAADAQVAATDAVNDAATAVIDMAAKKASEKIAAFMDNNNTVLDAGTEYVNRLNSLTEKYASVGRSTLNYKIYKNDEINMLALSDGSIRVYSAMMDALSDDELIAVIATQIGHIENRDTQETLIKAADKGNATDAASAQADKLLSFAGDKLGSIVNELLQVPYTEEQNKAADEFAFDLLMKNGNSTDGLVSALRKFAEMEAAPSTSEQAEKSAKFTKVNSNNSSRASLMNSK